MEDIVFFRLQSKNMLKDVRTIYLDSDGYYNFKPKYFDDLYDILYDFKFYAKDIGEGKQTFSLMNAQHIVANLVGFKSWNALIKANKTMLWIARSLFEHLNDSFDGYPYVDVWNDYYHKNLKNVDDESVLKIYKYTFLGDKNALD